jgi:hypothetical protein
VPADLNRKDQPILVHINAVALTSPRPDAPTRLAFRAGKRAARGTYSRDGRKFVTALTREEFVSLRDGAKGLMHRMPAGHKSRLIELGI